jgi:glycosyltransferase involved in cell wall biosynthesis
MIKERSLTWSLVVATYKREKILPICLALAAKQTRPPKEIIVVDASPYWHDTKEKVMADVASAHGGIRWEYRKAAAASSAVQRNQGVKLSTSDILFIIDDDSLMYHDCAEKIMDVYEADVLEKVAGVEAQNVGEPPIAPGLLSEYKKSSKSFYSEWYDPFLLKLAPSLYSLKAHFLPYDPQYPSHAIPKELAQNMNICPTILFEGYRMTFRRKYIEKEPFEEMLMGPSRAEDLDISYRISRRGALLISQDARLYHVEFPSGDCRHNRFFISLTTALNMAVFHAVHGEDARRSEEKLRNWIVKRTIVSSAKDIITGRWSVPRGRGHFTALLHLHDIFAKDKEELKRWYPHFQQRLIEKHNKTQVMT